MPGRPERPGGQGAGAQGPDLGDRGALLVCEGDRDRLSLAREAHAQLRRSLAMQGDPLPREGQLGAGAIAPAQQGDRVKGRV